MTDRWTTWGPAAIWAGVLFFLSAVPGSGSPPWFFHGEDKVAHLILYLVLGATLAWARARTPEGVGPAGLLFGGFAYAASDEWHQSFVPGRDPSLGDLAADTVGLLLGYWLFSRLFLYLTRRAEAGAVISNPLNQPGPPPA